MGLHKSNISKAIDLLDWGYALREHSYEDLELLFGVSRHVIQVAATSFYRRKMFENKQINKVETPSYLISEDDLKCKDAWMNSNERQYIKQLNN